LGLQLASDLAKQIGGKLDQMRIAMLLDSNL
jgi:hypothetical protein